MNLIKTFTTLNLVVLSADSHTRVLWSADDDVSLSAPDRDELQNVLRTLNSKLEDIRTCSDLIQKHGSSLQRAVVELELSESASDAAVKMKPVNERATLFRITSSAMINVRQTLSGCLSLSLCLSVCLLSLIHI